jgi:serine/threonine protein kinase
VLRAPAISHPYYFLRVLGEGGFGRVYHAIEQSLDRAVAIKVFREAGSTDQMNWFRDEGRVVASLAHPGIVSVYISGLTVDGRWYITY